MPSVMLETYGRFLQEEPKLPSLSRAYLQLDHWMEISSTSKTRTLLGGMRGGIPLSP